MWDGAAQINTTEQNRTCSKREQNVVSQNKNTKQAQRQFLHL